MSLALAAVGAFGLVGGITMIFVAYAKAPHRRNTALVALLGTLSASVGAGLIYGSVIA